LLTKTKIFKKKPSTSAKKPKDCAHQEFNRFCHARVVSHSACGTERGILLKSLADRILAEDSITTLMNSVIDEEA